MPILSQDIANAMRAALDAEGADHYNDQLDIIPAINNSVRWLEAVVNATLGQKKPGEEIFRDLTYADVFRTSAFSRVSLLNFRFEVWTINAVEVLPQTDTTGAAAPLMPNDKQSYYRPDLFHVRPTKYTKRLTIEEWTISTNENPFAPGYRGAAICDGIKEYAYLNPVTYNPDNSVSIASEIEISPDIDKGLVTVFYAKKPTPVVTLADNIEFPSTVFQILLARALAYISTKQGDGTNLWSISQSDINMLIQAIN
jgi:hypothetical protein